MIHSVVPTPEKHKTPGISLEHEYYSRKKPPTDSSSTFLRTEISRMKKLSSLPGLKSKEMSSSTSPVGVECSRVSTENDHWSKLAYKPTPE